MSAPCICSSSIFLWQPFLEPEIAGVYMHACIVSRNVVLNTFFITSVLAWFIIMHATRGGVVEQREAMGFTNKLSPCMSENSLFWVKHHCFGISLIGERSIFDYVAWKSLMYSSLNASFPLPGRWCIHSSGVLHGVQPFCLRENEISSSVGFPGINLEAFSFWIFKKLFYFKLGISRSGINLTNHSNRLCDDSRCPTVRISSLLCPIITLFSPTRIPAYIN